MMWTEVTQSFSFEARKSEKSENIKTELVTCVWTCSRLQSRLFIFISFHFSAKCETERSFKINVEILAKYELR